MITDGSEFFYFVPGLTPPKEIVRDTLVDDIKFFVDWLQKNAESIRYLFEYHHQSFEYTMRMLQDILNSMYARWLANDADKILKVSEGSGDDLSRKLVSSFIVDAHTLAIDIQMAQRNIALKFASEIHSEKETYRDVISVARIIFSLLNQSDYEQAINFAEDVVELRRSEFGAPLIECMVTRDKKRAMTLIDNIIAVYTKKIDDINRSATDKSGLKTLVLVDDMPEILTALYHMLKDYYQVFTFTEGFQALNFIDKKQKADAFVLDLDMPGIDGFALAQSIRDRDEYKTTPILILTSHSAKETILQAQHYNVKAFIVKPTSKDVIISKLNDSFNS